MIQLNYSHRCLPVKKLYFIKVSLFYVHGKVSTWTWIKMLRYVQFVLLLLKDKIVGCYNRLFYILVMVKSYWVQSAYCNRLRTLELFPTQNDSLIPCKILYFIYRIVLNNKYPSLINRIILHPIHEPITNPLPLQLSISFFISR